MHPDFPHEPTLDQWFGESRFEAYRTIGEYIIENVIGSEAPEVGPTSSPPRRAISPDRAGRATGQEAGRRSGSIRNVPGRCAPRPTQPMAAIPPRCSAWRRT
jgi:hypothetical protein